MITRVLIFFLFVITTTVLGGFAQAQVTGDPTDPSAVGYSKVKKKNVTPWTFAGATSASRGADPLARFFLNHSLSVVFRSSAKETWSTNLSYSLPADRRVNHPEDWGLEDLNLSYSRNGVFSIIENTVSSLRLSATAPTSNRSQMSSLRLSLNASLPTRFSWSGNTIILSPRLRVANHGFETADIWGIRRNSPLGLGLTAIATRSLYKGLSAAVVTSYVGVFDYEFQMRHLQALGINITQSLYKSLNVTAGYTWRDRVISHLAVFDDDRSNFSISLSMVF